MFTPERILAILHQSGVQRALVSTMPDDATLQLYAAAPQRIVPCLRPYRTREDTESWPSDPAVQAYVEERLKRGRGRNFKRSCASTVGMHPLGISWAA